LKDTSRSSPDTNRLPNLAFTRLQRKGSGSTFCEAIPARLPARPSRRRLPEGGNKRRAQPQRPSKSGHALR